MSTQKERERDASRYNEALREQVARRNRAEFPEAAEFVDKVRAAFGPDVQVTYFGPVRERPEPEEVRWDLLDS